MDAHTLVPRPRSCRATSKHSSASLSAPSAGLHRSRACACADLRKALRPDPLGARNQIRATIGETATAPPPAAEPNAAAAGSPRAPSEAASLLESTLVGRGGFGKAAVARTKKSS